MSEKNFNQPRDYSLAEKEVLSLEYFRAQAHEVAADQFDKIYQPLKNQIGINSPGVMLYPGIAKALKVDEVLGLEKIDNFVILIDKDSVPDKDYLDYLKEHECWEIYIAHKEGFNMSNYEAQDSVKPLLDRTRPNHRYSCYKEFQMAQVDGKAQEYLKWWHDFYQKDRDRVANLSESELAKIAPAYQSNKPTREAILEFIDKNEAIKDWAYQKVREGQGREERLEDIEAAA